MRIFAVRERDILVLVTDEGVCYQQESTRKGIASSPAGPRNDRVLTQFPSHLGRGLG
jgi:hypothetical protein